MDEDIFYQKLGARIKFLREKAGMTQEKLAEKSGISLDYMGKIEVNIWCPGPDLNWHEVISPIGF